MNSYSSLLVRRLSILRQLQSPGDGWLFVRILALAASVPLLLRLPLPTLERQLESRYLFPSPLPRDVDKLANYVEGALQLVRPLIRSSCLTRGLTLYHCLRRAGLDVNLDFGIGTIEGEVTGHCWVVYQGQPLREPRDPQAL